MSFPSSKEMDVDAEPPNTSISPPTQQSPPDSPARPRDTDRNQVSSPANASPGLRPMISPVRGRQTTNVNQIQDLNSASEAATATSSMGSRSLALAMGPEQAKPSASLTPISNNVATQCFKFLELPAELKAHVLSFLPAQEIASTCRAVCPELRDFIDRNESHISRLNIMHSHADLQHRINTLAQMKPHDFDSFVSCVRYWVAQRGFARYVRKSAYKPLDDWIILVSGHQDGQQCKARYRWRSLTRRLVLLQQDIICNPATKHARLPCTGSFLSTRQRCTVGPPAASCC